MKSSQKVQGVRNAPLPSDRVGRGAKHRKQPDPSVGAPAEVGVGKLPDPDVVLPGHLNAKCGTAWQLAYTDCAPRST